MAIFAGGERRQAEGLGALVYVNPFRPQRIEAERLALGRGFREDEARWNLSYTDPARYGNVDTLVERSVALSELARQRIADGRTGSKAEVRLYEDVVLFRLYHQYREAFDGTIAKMVGGATRVTIRYYAQFAEEAERLLGLPPVRAVCGYEVSHLFACFFQIRRAFHHIFASIVGASGPAVRLRAAVWESIFTHDLRRYRRVLFHRMNDVATLITGPSGTGKELVARAIGLSRYVPFDAQRRVFTEDFAGAFYPLNLSALSPTLIESELFGHRRGAFTGAVSDRAGWLAVCPALGAVFLDEIGDVDASIQVKLLRVLQTRTFSRLGDTEQLTFAGKVIAATHRDLADAMARGDFRADLYYRMCSDLIVTPSLHEQLADDAGDLHRLVVHLAERMVGDEAEAVAGEVEAWIEKELGSDYAWPGNVRELEQCVRNVMIRGEYRPSRTKTASAFEQFAEQITAGALSLEELTAHYCRLVYEQCGTYQETARRLGIDRRTVKAKVTGSG